MISYVLEVRNLRKKYGDIEALRGVSFSLRRGELFALLGPNGAGKTTTLRILSGITNPTSGEVYLNGASVFENPLLAKKRIGFVPQNINLDLELTVYENLLIHGLLFEMPLKEIKIRINELLEFSGLKDRRDSKVKELSGGLRRRLLIIRALLHKPELLLLDEPTVGLDPHIRRKVWSFIKLIQNKGTTILLTTHYMEEAEMLSERVAFIFKGKIIALDTPSNFIKSLGNYAVAVFSEDGMKTYYFADKKEAEENMLRFSQKNNYVSLRKITLEDVFIKLMERQI